jgi:hypothetical protein
MLKRLPEHYTPMTEQEARDALALYTLLNIDQLQKAEKRHLDRPDYARWFADRLVDQLKLSGIALFRAPPMRGHSTSSGQKT